MRYISLFSGIEAASVAWQPLGFEPVAFSEIDPYCRALLDYYYPNVPNLGDITNVNFKKYRNKCDIIIGGSPCQSFSIAGNRTGRAGESGLMAEYIRAVREVRPRWFVWENVPGAFSVERGQAFRQFLSEMEKLGYCLSWRVLDAQYFGLAQRRKRVYAVGSFGDASSAEILFEPESLRGDYSSSREVRQALAAEVDGRTVGDDGFRQNCLTPWDPQSKRCYSVDGVAPTLQSGTNRGKSMQPTILTAANKEGKVIAFKVRGGSPTYIKHDGKIGTAGKGLLESDNMAFTVASTQDQYLMDGWQVRRLTPRECERLQGFPDDYTLIPYKNGLAKDAPRYKTLGNSFAVPVIEWIGKRIADHDRH